MKKAELELIIKRLNVDLGYNKEQIKQWLAKPFNSNTNCCAIDYLNLDMGRFILNYIDTLKENKQ
jgi:hypothetical protein